ncbi:hypothetical protein M3Y96_01046300 [Aphelenchoides besseyi]|nr:hypothetical protein M3Y96_01046300 [Aphelenchoides besseyi]
MSLLTQQNSLSATVEYMSTGYDLYWLTDTTGTIFELLANMLLILSAFNTVSSTAFFAFTELATQHQLIVKRGIMYVLPRGLKQRLSPSLYPIFALPHESRSFSHVYNDEFQKRNIAIAFAESFGLDNCKWNVHWHLIGCCIYQTKECGDEFYISQLNKNWRQNNDLKYFMYAVDITERFWCNFFFYGGLVFAFIWVTVAAFYTYKAWKFVNTT